ncbi:hypothetical protein [uncultured Chryseobacterium sp.]|uniref:hypothetical protein n=1 Tax=uncultured Chryseobacterium sp. TaxID=259322 RepID=UPI0025F64130|nr:hypothetical protein [uncultured Chryseobacterium sp.]
MRFGGRTPVIRSRVRDVQGPTGGRGSGAAQAPRRNRNEVKPEAARPGKAPDFVEASGTRPNLKN